MKTSFQINSDIQIPVHLYNEAAELFLNHLKKYYEAQLCSNDSLSLSSEKLLQSQNAQMAFQYSLSFLGKTCPLYYKKHKDACNARPHYQNQT